MTEIEVAITNSKGLHSRPAAKLVQKAAEFKSKVKFSSNGKVADGKSIISVMGMMVKQNAMLTIVADGEDEAECIAALKELVASNFGEE